MKRIAMLVFVFHAGAALAADPCARQPPANAAQCATHEYERLDQQVTARYEQLLRKFASPDARKHLDDPDEAKALLVATQRSWKNYRGQHCRTVMATVRSNTAEVGWRSACLSRITKARLVELREIDKLF